MLFFKISFNIFFKIDNIALVPDKNSMYLDPHITQHWKAPQNPDPDQIDADKFTNTFKNL